MSTRLTTTCLCLAFNQCVLYRHFRCVISCRRILIYIEVPRPSDAGTVAENQIYANSQPQFDIGNFDFAADLNWPMRSAFDINLGEFLLDSDMQFLDSYFRKEGLSPDAPALAPV